MDTVYLLVCVCVCVCMCVRVCVLCVLFCMCVCSDGICLSNKKLCMLGEGKLVIKALFQIEDTSNLALLFTLLLGHRILSRLSVVAVSGAMKQMSGFQKSHISFWKIGKNT